MLFYPNSIQPILLNEKYEFIENFDYFSYIKNSFLIYANNKIFYNGKKIGKLKNALHKKFLVNLILANSNV